jgi:LAO/AO transport system kinase
MPGEQGAYPRRREIELAEYVRGVRSRQIAVLARALTLLESNLPRHQLLAEELLTQLLPFTGKAIRVGITGAPGSGKSTFIEALGMYLVRRGQRVAVLAVDPSSGISGGSILGDKTRMAKLASEPNAYIRPSPSAGTLGGVARKTRESMLVCEAAGFEVVLVETVGVGQSETMVADMTDIFLALMQPGAGDELQGMKRGLLELVDVIVVNKADGALRRAAEVSARQFRTVFETLPLRDDGRETPHVFTCSALENVGIDTIWQAVESRQAELVSSNKLAERRRRQELRWLWSTVEDRLRQQVYKHPQVCAIRAQLEQEVLAGQIPAEAAARRILDAFGIAVTEETSPL